MDNEMEGPAAHDVGSVEMAAAVGQLPRLI